NAMPRQRYVHDTLASFEPCAYLRRAAEGRTALAELITDAGDQRQRGHDDRQDGELLFGKRNEPRHVTCVDSHALGISGDAAVPGSAPDFLYAGALLQLPDERVLASAPANHQNVHESPSGPLTLDASNVRCQPDWHTV